MKKTIKVALIGLGEVGEAFAEHFLEKIQEGGMPIEIVAVADKQVDSPVAMGFSQNGIPVFRDGREIVKMGDKVDIIFDLSGNSATSQDLRLKLMESKNRHTVIAPEVLARLLWFFFDEGRDLPDGQAASNLLAS
jgi:homoserine dehydrogenase